MKDLNIYLAESEQVDEGIFKPAIGFMYIKKMDPNYLLEGLLNMYNYIVDKSNIKLFYQDFPIKERPFWEFVYKLYEKKVWSIFDAPKEDSSSKEDNSSEPDDITSCFTEENELIDVTPEFRRKLREIIRGSSNQEDINSANVKKIMLVSDPQFDRRYIFTINKVQGIFRNMFRAIDIKMLESMFEKISER